MSEQKKLTQLAIEHGQTFYKKRKDGEVFLAVPTHDSPFRRDHAVADILHGWTAYENKESVNVMLSDDDYLSAIEAAKKGSVHAPASKREE